MAEKFPIEKHFFVTLYRKVIALINLFYMPQYTFDDDGNAIGVFLPIGDWNRLKTKYEDLDSSEDFALPKWQMDIIDKRLAEIEANPARLRPIEELYEELDKD